LTDPIRLAVLVSVCGVLWSIEAIVPLIRYEPGRFRRAFPNLVLAAGVVLTNLAFASVTAAFSEFLVRRHFGLFSSLRLHPWILLLLGIAGLDLFAYFAHLLLHKIPLGWIFHRVHHSELEVDVTTAFRQHPGETLWRVLWQLFAIAVFGLPFWIVPFYLSISSFNALLEHANVRVNERLDGWLRLLIVTPNMHKIHHSRIVAETDSNYSNIFSMWDRLCGTHTARTNYGHLRYGLDGFDDQRGVVKLMMGPFRTS